MFLRWRQRPLRRQPDSTLEAVLVQSVRVGGQPRQQTVGYLGSIRAQYRLAPAYRQAFWRSVERRLAVLDLPLATRQALEGQLAQQVPRPTPEELGQVAAQQAALRQLLGGLHGQDTA